MINNESRINRLQWLTLLVLVVVLLVPGGLRAAETSGPEEAVSADSDATSSDTISVCHRVADASGPKQTIEVQADEWEKHQSHGDDKGRCSGIVMVNSYRPASGMQDFKMASDTRLKYLLTTDALKVFDGGTITRSIEPDTDESIILSKDTTPRAVNCEDRTSSFDSESEKALVCQLLNSSGRVSDTAYFPNHSEALSLLGNKLLVSERGTVKFYDYGTDTYVWELSDEIREVRVNETHRYFLSFYSQDFQMTHELRRLETGELISKAEADAFHRELSDDGSYFYLVDSDPGSRTKTLMVYNRDFEKLAQWEELPFHGGYFGEFSVKDREVFVPLRNGKLLVGNLETGRKRMKSFPGSDFTPLHARFDRKKDLLFIYGINAGGNKAGVVSPNTDRRLIVYDVQSGSYLSNQVRFSTGWYQFDLTLGNTALRKLSGSMLALQHPGTLEIYRYTFD